MTKTGTSLARWQLIREAVKNPPAPIIRNSVDNLRDHGLLKKTRDQGKTYQTMPLPQNIQNIWLPILEPENREWNENEHPVWLVEISIDGKKYFGPTQAEHSTPERNKEGNLVYGLPTARNDLWPVGRRIMMMMSYVNFVKLTIAVPKDGDYVPIPEVFCVLDRQTYMGDAPITDASEDPRVAAAREAMAKLLG